MSGWAREALTGGFSSGRYGVVLSTSTMLHSFMKGWSQTDYAADAVFCANPNQMHVRVFAPIRCPYVYWFRKDVLRHPIKVV
jgi:hypothetical protein